MKIILLGLLTLGLFGCSTLKTNHRTANHNAVEAFRMPASDTLTLKALEKSVLIDPAFVTHFTEHRHTEANTGILAHLIGGAYLHQTVFVSIGHQEGKNEGLDTFSFSVVGNIINSEAHELGGGNVTVKLRTDMGSYDNTTGQFKTGVTEYKVQINKDGNTPTGFSRKVKLTKSFFNK